MKDAVKVLIANFTSVLERLLLKGKEKRFGGAHPKSDRALCVD